MNFRKYSFSSKPKQINSSFKFELNKGGTQNYTSNYRLAQ